MSGTSELVELPPSVDAVPHARRLTRRALAGAPDDLVGDVELVVSELVANAALHGAPPLRLRLVAGEPVRVEVHDGGRAVPVRVRTDDAAMTGRGLGLVAVLASSWGVDAADGTGKVVWAEVATAGAGGPRSGHTTGEVDAEALLAAWDDGSEERHTVTIGAVSTELLLAAKAHIDNLVRELTLLREQSTPLAPGVAALVTAATVDFAEARAEIKRQAASAAARGEVLTDLVLHLPAGAADAGERYLAALDEADRAARAGRMLTLEPPRVHRILRRWYVSAIVASLRAQAAGRAAPTPEPLQVVLAREVTALDELLTRQHPGAGGGG